MTRKLYVGIGTIDELIKLAKPPEENEIFISLSSKIDDEHDFGVDLAFQICSLEPYTLRGLTSEYNTGNKPDESSPSYKYKYFYSSHTKQDGVKDFVKKIAEINNCTVDYHILFKQAIISIISIENKDKLDGLYESIDKLNEAFNALWES